MAYYRLCEVDVSSVFGTLDGMAATMLLDPRLRGDDGILAGRRHPRGMTATMLLDPRLRGDDGVLAGSHRGMTAYLPADGTPAG
ncbi:MAG: hypothetical protein U5K56_17285 [Halioglobus sp.]|nr:hypothetical protein [Halioglobus sp.]